MNQPLVPIQSIDRLSDEEVLRRVLYRDGLILVFDKPAGIAVHNAGPCLHNLLQYGHLLQFGLPKPPTLAHRLDRPTSGCLVLARNLAAAQKMQQLFSEGHIKKTYFAVVHGEVNRANGLIDIPLRKLSTLKTGWRMCADPQGDVSALTDMHVIVKTPAWSLLKLMPLTGRTHQLRVHCQAIGHPIIGDPIYGEKNDLHEPLHLHAHDITIPLYPKKAPLFVAAEWPQHMKQTVNEKLEGLPIIGDNYESCFNTL